VGRVCIAVVGRTGSPHAIEKNNGDIGREGVRRQAVADALKALIENAANAAGQAKGRSRASARRSTRRANLHHKERDNA
jgi:hypothetical protein